MASYDDIVDLLARAGVPYQIFDRDMDVQEVTPEYCSAIDDAMAKTGVNQYMYIQMLMRCIDQLYDALECTLDALDDYCDEFEDSVDPPSCSQLH